MITMAISNQQTMKQVADVQKPDKQNKKYYATNRKFKNTQL